MGAIRTLCIFYLLAWPLTPIFRVGTSWRILFVAAFSVFFLLSLNTFFRRIGLCFAITVAHLAFFGLLWMRYGDAHWSIFISTFIYYALSFVFIYYLEEGFEKFKPCFWLLLVWFSVWNLTTIIMLFKDPLICRRLGNSSDDLSSVYLSNFELLMTGGFATVYSAALAAPRMLDLIFSPPKSEADKKEKIAALLFLGTGIFLVLQALYSIAIVVLFLGILLWILRKRLSLPILFFVMGLFAFFLYVLKDSFYKILLYFADDKIAYVNKIESLFNPLSSHTEAEGRFSLWSESLNSFFENPLVGAGNMGGHSGVLDLFGCYGLFFGAGVFLTWILPFLILRKKMIDSGTYGVLIAAFMPFLILISLNPLQFSYASVIFALMPYIFMRYYIRRHTFPSMNKRGVAL